MNVEQKFNILGAFKFLLQKVTSKKIKFDNLHIEQERALFNAIIDAVEYQKISYEKFWDNVKEWAQIEEELFKKYATLKEFYESWNKDFAFKNICANVVNQMLYPEIYSAYVYYAKQSKSIIDYGCGTATLSLGEMILNKERNKQLILLDVENDITNFVKYRINKYNLLNNVKFENVFDFKTEDKSDLIICIDVLEHLENSADVFCDEIYPKLKKYGFLILRAPWRGQLTHLDKAADDFYINGGKKLLSKKFSEIYRFGSIDISCIYIKIK